MNGPTTRTSESILSLALTFPSTKGSTLDEGFLHTAIRYGTYYLMHLMEKISYNEIQAFKMRTRRCLMRQLVTVYYLTKWQ